ncbi:MAG TPA: glycosyl hydrolase [Polyangiaceae bacterium]|nr:glycosyl hydrolase [Polyangiaceae bacterium]
MHSQLALGWSALAALALACSSDAQNGSGGAAGAGGAGSSSAMSGGTSPTSGGMALSAGASAVGGPGAGRGGNGGTPTNGPSPGGSTSGGAINVGGAPIGDSGMGGVGSGGSGADGGSPDAGDPDILVPATGALIGQYYGDASIAATGQKLGRTLPLHLTYYAWSDDWTRDNTAADLKAGRVPFVNWELYEGGDLAQIIAGDFDDMLEERATDAKALGKKLFLDLGAEMNGDWSPWSGAQNGESSAQFIAMFRHVHDKLKSADNIVWVWCPNVTDEPNEDWNQALSYYPGDDYVDWTCVDGYNWGSSGDGWQSFQTVFKNIYPKLAAKNKPIMIGEMASAEVGGDKAAWIAQIIPTLKTSFPLIKGLVWFDVDKETDWRISSSTASEAAFKKMVNDPYFNP